MKSLCSLFVCYCPRCYIFIIINILVLFVIHVLYVDFNDKKVNLDVNHFLKRSKDPSKLLQTCRCITSRMVHQLDKPAWIRLLRTNDLVRVFEVVILRQQTNRQLTRLKIPQRSNRFNTLTVSVYLGQKIAEGLSLFSPHFDMSCRQRHQDINVRTTLYSTSSIK